MRIRQQARLARTMETLAIDVCVYPGDSQSRLRFWHSNDITIQSFGGVSFAPFWGLWSWVFWSFPALVWFPIKRLKLCCSTESQSTAGYAKWNFEFRAKWTVIALGDTICLSSQLIPLQISAQIQSSACSTKSCTASYAQQSKMRKWFQCGTWMLE